MTATYLNPKDTAAVLRQVLRDTFPGTRFSVTTGRGSGVSSVRIRYTEGPTLPRVEAIAKRFEAGHFDGMTDSYTYDREAVVIVGGQTYNPGTRYVFVERENSPAAVLRALDAVLSRRWAWASPDIEDRVMTARDNLAANPCRDTVDLLYSVAFNVYPGDSRNTRQGRDLAQMLREALNDRTAYTNPSHGGNHR